MSLLQFEITCAILRNQKKKNVAQKKMQHPACAFTTKLLCLCQKFSRATLKFREMLTFTDLTCSGSPLANPTRRSCTGVKSERTHSSWNPHLPALKHHSQPRFWDTVSKN
jgi:hypothetical protein